MSSLTFREQPTLADLNAFCAHMDALKAQRYVVLLQAQGEREKRRADAALVAQLEREADRLFMEMARLEHLHQMEAYDWREYRSEGLELPPHRLKLYAEADPCAAFAGDRVRAA